MSCAKVTPKRPSTPNISKLPSPYHHYHLGIWTYRSPRRPQIIKRQYKINQSTKKGSQSKNRGNACKGKGNRKIAKIKWRTTTWTCGWKTGLQRVKTRWDRRWWWRLRENGRRKGRKCRGDRWMNDEKKIHFCSKQYQWWVTGEWQCSGSTPSTSENLIFCVVLETYSRCLSNLCFTSDCFKNSNLLRSLC